MPFNRPCNSTICPPTKVQPSTGHADISRMLTQQAVSLAPICGTVRAAAVSESSDRENEGAGRLLGRNFPAAPRG